MNNSLPAEIFAPVGATVSSSIAFAARGECLGFAAQAFAGRVSGDQAAAAERAVALQG